MKILKYKKIGKDKYKITLDDNKEIELYEDVIVKNNLLLNKEIEDDKLDALLKQNEEEKNYFLALKYISIKMRSIKEIKNYLSKKNVSNNVIQNIVKRLIKEGYLNDALFVKAFINDQINLTLNGPIKIKNELLKHDINKDVIDEEISKIDNNLIKEKLNKLLKKQLKIKKGSYNSVKNKLINHFINLGYYKEDILNEISLLDIKTDDTKLKKDYERLYSKYKSKYNGDRLNYFIMQKLYLKGYTKEDINKVIKEDVH
ncbi:MAG TPA: RecX family transcriptional regulator [Candidatus Aphodocola excrementigallinarum]|uniref:Regulatory protein RecX n=1 Tax=Candidatus Aphodocola excrementigallinarum TaxID=2840670 RepID=A0A9D1IRI8_9FIRM|nr:RecX family transcriptional regulator [Candidatus Aphodocola excrementigallinarum]